jgi:oxygen-dependent protoporphyrinogen oxidase
MERQAQTGERVLVVGAGIAGLTAALRLQQQGCEVTVLEASHRPGGRMVTLERDGFKMDLAAVVLSSKYVQMRRLIGELALDGAVVPAPDGIAIPKDGTVHRLASSSVRGALTTRLLGPRAKLRATRAAWDGLRLGRRYDWNDLGAARGFDRETAMAWALRRGGPELGHVVDAVVRGGLMTDPSVMSAIDLQFLMVKFFGAGLFSFADGVGVLPDALAARLDVRLGARVTGVEEDARGVRLTFERGDEPERTLHADACVLAVSARQMAAIHPQLPGDLRAIVEDVEYVRLVSVNLATDVRPAEPAMMYAFPRVAEPDLCGLFFPHNRHPARAPAGKGLVNAIFHHDWNTRHWDAPDAWLIEQAARAAGRWVPGVEDSVLWGHVERWDPAFIYSRPGTYRRLHRVAAARSQARRIHLAGDYFGGPSTNTSLCSGELAAGLVLRHLRRTGRGVAALPRAA